MLTVIQCGRLLPAQTVNTVPGPLRTMKISVIITTYNAVEWLQKLLWGFAAQEF